MSWNHQIRLNSGANKSLCRDIDKVSAHSRWPLMTGSPKAGTTVCPTTTMIIGWVWNLGTIQASSHRIATLASCDTPLTVKAMRSFVGAYKMLARVIPGCSALLAPFDSVTGGRQSSEHIEWNDSLQEAFKRAKDKLQTRTTITLPRSTDELWLVTDGSVK